MFDAMLVPQHDGLLQKLPTPCCVVYCKNALPRYCLVVPFNVDVSDDVQRLLASVYERPNHSSVVVMVSCIITPMFVPPKPFNIYNTFVAAFLDVCGLCPFVVFAYIKITSLSFHL